MLAHAKKVAEQVQAAHSAKAVTIENVAATNKVAYFMLTYANVNDIEQLDTHLMHYTNCVFHFVHLHSDTIIVYLQK